MEQLTLFKPPYEYIIDTSSILSQKPTEPHRRNVYKRPWEMIEASMQEQRIVTCSEILEEITDKEISQWLKRQQCVVLDIDEDIQHNVRRIVTEHPKMIEFTGKSGTSSGDAFLIATAMKYDLIVITEEKSDKANKIPMICKDYGIKALNLTELFDRENWTF